MMTHFPVRVLWFVVAVLSVAGCTDASQTAQKLEGQVVARIGPDVVTKQELENELRHANVPTANRKDSEILKKTIGDLVARKHAARRGLEAKLDREPTVLLDLLRSKDQVLATAIVNRDVEARLAALSNAEIEKYIAGNPFKFANRQLLRVEQLIVPISSALQPVIDASRSMKSLEEVSGMLSEMGIQSVRGGGTLNTTELPDELAIAIRNQGLDAVLFIRGAGPNGSFLKVVGREAQPLTGSPAEAVARQLIRQDLTKSQASMAAFTSNMEATYYGE